MKIKNKTGKRDQLFQGFNSSAVLNSVVRKDSKNKWVTFEHRPEASEVVSHERTERARVLRLQLRRPV